MPATHGLPRAHRRGTELGVVLAGAGRADEAVEEDDLEKRSHEEYVSPQSFAVVRLGLGEKEQALSRREQADGERAIEWLGFATEVTLRRMGLPTVAPPTVMAGGVAGGPRAGLPTAR
jgi:hypothetical protein